MWTESRFNIYLPEANADVLVINALRRSIASLPSSLASHIRENSVSQAEVDDLGLSSLCENGMLVPTSTDELRSFAQWYERISSDLASVRCTIAVTSSCNLNCAYCFESGALRDRVHSMTEETANSAISWISAFARYAGTQHIRIVFYGGEPTLAHRRMLQIAESAKHELLPRAQVTFGMYSNGVVFPDKVLDLCSQPEFQWAQIALDGPREVHDRRRLRVDGSRTFDEIWRNIGILVQECDVHVRIVLNFDRDNYAELPQLLEQIARSEWRTGVEVAFNPIFDTGLNREYCTAHNFPQHESYELWRGLYEEAVRLGLYTPFLRMLDKGPCAIHRVGNLYVSPKGAVFECIGLLGMETHKTGTVLESFCPESIGRRTDWIAEHARWSEQCTKCPLLPLCLGGCRFKALCETGDVKGWMCHRDLIETCELPLAHLAKEVSESQ